MLVRVMAELARQADYAHPDTTSAPNFGTQAHHYNDAAKLYADPKIRPHYPITLFERVYDYAGGPFDAALDVATGTGQCARQLASKYQQASSLKALQ